MIFVDKLEKLIGDKIAQAGIDARLNWIEERLSDYEVVITGNNSDANGIYEICTEISVAFGITIDVYFGNNWYIDGRL